MNVLFVCIGNQGRSFGMSDVTRDHLDKFWFLVDEILNAVLFVLVGFEVISKVPATLHTPLMSAANSIHGIVLAGAMLIAVTADNALGYILAFVAAAFAAMNVVGGYVVTGRMLKMFRRSRAPVPAPDTPAAVNGQSTGGRA